MTVDVVDVVDVVNGAGDRAVGEEAARHLADGGITVGTVTDTAETTTSGIEYPHGARKQAQLLAETLDAVDLLRRGTVPHVTVVLGAKDASVLVEALRDFTGLTCASAPTAADDGSNG